MKFLNVLGLNNPSEEYQETPPQEDTSQSNKTTSSTNHSYFEKKGEVNELKKIFKDLMEKAPVSNPDLQEALKKVIGVMTLGIDLSSIFTEILMFTYTNDIVSKKMIYLYLVTYAKTNNDTAIMAINTFMKDCTNQDAKIRGHALKTLCSLQTSNSLEYMKEQVLNLIDDKDYYVRKIAVMGCLRLYYQDYNFFRERELIDKLYNLIKDPHKSVVISAINVLNEIMIREGGMAINSKIILYLMNRFDDFDSYGKQTILLLLIKYEPANQQEMLDLMNLLEDNLKKNHHPLCLAIINVFVQFTKNNKEIFDQVIRHIQPKLLMMVCSAQDEDLFNVLKHIDLFVQSSTNSYFKDYYKLFYCRANEKDFNSKLKIKILVRLADENSCEQIIEELSEYVFDQNFFLSSYAIFGMGELAENFPEKALLILKRLLIVIKIGEKKTLKVILSVLKDIINVISEIPEELTVIFQTFFYENISKDLAITLLVLISKKPKAFQIAPYLAEHILNLMLEEKIEIERDLLNCFLNSIVRIFISKPGETLPVLSRFYSFLFMEEKKFVNDVDLFERANFYYNLLKTNPNQLKEIFSREMKQTKKLDLNEQFLSNIEKFGLNDLRIIYEKPQTNFIKPAEFFMQNLIEKSEESDTEEIVQEKKEKELDFLGENMEDKDIDILNLNSNKLNQKEEIVFKQNYEIEGGIFQQKWLSFINKQNKK